MIEDFWLYYALWRGTVWSTIVFTVFVIVYYLLVYKGKIKGHRRLQKLMLVLYVGLFLLMILFRYYGSDSSKVGNSL